MTGSTLRQNYGGSNNINNLLDASGWQLLEISQSRRYPIPNLLLFRNAVPGHFFIAGLTLQSKGC
jgi:hypothetical protein